MNQTNNNQRPPKNLSPFTFPQMTGYLKISKELYDLMKKRHGFFADPKTTNLIPLKREKYKVKPLEGTTTFLEVWFKNQKTADRAAFNLLKHLAANGNSGFVPDIYLP
jgi:hypothetical protein